MLASMRMRKGHSSASSENFLFFFKGPRLWHMEVPGPGIKLELQLRPTPQPEQRRIIAASATYAAAEVDT